MKGSETTGHCLATLLGLTRDIIVTGEHEFLPSIRDEPKPNGICQSLLMPFSVSTKGEKGLKSPQGPVRRHGIWYWCWWCPTTRKACPGEVVESPSLEVFKKGVAMTLKDMV